MSKIKNRTGYQPTTTGGSIPSSILIPSGTNINTTSVPGAIVTYPGTYTVPNNVHYSYSTQGMWIEPEIEFIQLSPVAITHKKSGKTLVIWIP